MVWGVVLGGVMKSSLPGVLGGSAFRRFLSLAKNGRTRFVVVLLATMALLASVSGSILFSAYAQTPQAVPHIVITLHKSITLPMSQPYSSAVVGSPEIADAMPMTDRTLYIQGKSIGITNISIYDENMRLIKVVDVEVALDTTNLQQKIRASTGNTGIHVSNDNQQIVLSGMANDAVAADRAVNIATAWIGSGANGVVNGQGIRVVNAMTISSPQQVMLKVRFLEVSRQASRALGVNWTSVNAQGTRGATLGTRRSYNSATCTRWQPVADDHDEHGCSDHDECTNNLSTLRRLCAIRLRHFTDSGNVGRCDRRTIRGVLGPNRQQRGKY